MEAFSALPPSIYFCIVAVSIFAIAHRFSAHAIHTKEPPVIPSRLPFFGHLIGLLWYGKDYFRMLDEKYGFGIYTVPMLGRRFYVIASPTWAAAINRAPKSVSFRPIATSVSKTVGGLPPDIDKINQTNFMDEEGPSLHTVIHDGLSTMLPTGAYLDEAAQELLNGIAQNFDDLKESQLVDLYQFTRKMVGTSTMRALYGPGFSVLDSSLVYDYWDFDDTLAEFMATPFPQITVPKAYRARERMAKKLIAYFDQGLDKDACSVMRMRYKNYRNYGYTNEGLARTEISFLVGALPNSTITTFWVISHALSDPNLYKELFEEASKACIKEQDKAVIDMKIIRSTDNCPLLNSVIREVLRLNQHTGGVRKVLADTIIDGQYMLKKGSIVNIEPAVLHYKASIWGTDAADFNPRRFCGSPNGTSQSGKKVHPATFRSFGGGENLCPGRNLARDEILGIVAPILLGFDVTSVDGSPFTKPLARYDKIPSSAYKPAHEVPVCIRRRVGWENVHWEHRF